MYVEGVEGHYSGFQVIMVYLYDDEVVEFLRLNPSVEFLGKNLRGIAPEGYQMLAKNGRPPGDINYYGRRLHAPTE
jgi:hypothetical protein